MNKKQKLILVVDDEREIRSIISDILVEEGYEAIVASSAEEARHLLVRKTPDLVFLDIWMPDEDGITLLKEWAEDQSKQFPVIMISGHATIETAIKATKLGAADFIEKPISIENLFGTIDKVFGFFFGIIKAYVVVVCLYSAVEIIYNHEKWPLNLDDSFTYPWVEKGSNYLIKEFPDEKEYKDAKEKIQDI